MRCKSRHEPETPAAGDKAAGATAGAACAGCHGADGVSGNPANPSLAGQDATYLASALQAYKQGTRSDETMKGLAASLDDSAVKNVSAFYASQEPKQPNVRKPLTAEEWAQRCDRCHGVNGNSADPRVPALAAQRLDYLEKVLQDYRTGVRKSPPDGGNVRRADRRGYHQHCGPLRAPEGAWSGIFDAAIQPGYQVSRATRYLG